MPEKPRNGNLASLGIALLTSTLVSVLAGVMASPGELRKDQDLANERHRQDVAGLRAEVGALGRQLSAITATLDMLERQHGVFTDDDARAYAEQMRAHLAQLERDLRGRINELHRVP